MIQPPPERGAPSARLAKLVRPPRASKPAPPPSRLSTGRLAAMRSPRVSTAVACAAHAAPQPHENVAAKAVHAQRLQARVRGSCAVCGAAATCQSAMCQRAPCACMRITPVAQTITDAGMAALLQQQRNKKGGKQHTHRGVLASALCIPRASRWQVRETEAAAAAAATVQVLRTQSNRQRVVGELLASACF
jgi:hypothetical protein